MTFKDVLKERIHHDLGFDFYVKEGAPQRRFSVLIKEKAILCGMIFLPTIIKIVDDEFFLEPLKEMSPSQIRLLKRDGDTVNAGDVVAEISGNAEVLLKAERTICNLISELSGIATHVEGVVKSLRESAGSHENVFLLDTRKNDPLMRPEHKYAVRVGGSKNHRAGFFDGVLIKDNDISVHGGIRKAIDVRLGDVKFLTRVEIEVGNIEDLQAVLDDGRVDAILLDNMTVETLRKAVSMIKDSGRSYLIEASGVGEQDLAEICQTGVGFISLSSLVRKAPYIDVSMKIS